MNTRAVQIGEYLKDRTRDIAPYHASRWDLIESLAEAVAEFLAVQPQIVSWADPNDIKEQLLGPDR